MGRAADLGKRADLLRRVREYVIHNGLADLSLRPLAKALGTSDRMLLYYFGTKDRLVAEALAQDEGRPVLFLRRALDTAGAPADAAGMRRAVEELWRQFTPAERRAVLPVTFEVMTASVLNPSRYGPVMRNLLNEWRDMLTAAFMRPRHARRQSRRRGHAPGRCHPGTAPRATRRRRLGPGHSSLPYPPRPPRARLARR